MKTSGATLSSKHELSPKRGRKGVIKLAIMATGNIFGDDDALIERAHFGSVKCVSSFGVVYCIKTHEFLKKLQENEKKWALALKMALQKNINFAKRIS